MADLPYHSLSTAALRDELKRRSLSATGKKVELLQRLNADNRSASASDEGVQQRLRRLLSLSSENERGDNTGQRSDADENTILIQDELSVDSISIYRNPLVILGYFGHYLLYKAQSIYVGLLSRAYQVIFMMMVGVLLIYMSQMDAPHQRYLEMVRFFFKWYGYWVVLGILSSVGLGTGLHTFILFLGPHIAQVTSAAYSCRHLDFDSKRWERVTCQASSPFTREDFSELATHVTILTIANKVKWESFFWGLGTAIGELPPYFVARAAATSGKDNKDLKDFRALLRKPKHQRTIADRVKIFVGTGMKKFGFWGILACASIPNPLFDLAGLICGSFLIPFKTFFSATVLGKAVIKTSLQCGFVITLFSAGGTKFILSFLDTVAPALHVRFESFLLKQKAKFARETGHYESSDIEEEQGSVIGKVWDMMIYAMVGFFVLSIVESLARRQITRMGTRHTEDNSKKDKLKQITATRSSNTTKQERNQRRRRTDKDTNSINDGNWSGDDDLISYSEPEDGIESQRSPDLQYMLLQQHKTGEEVNTELSLSNNSKKNSKITETSASTRRPKRNTTTRI